MPHVSSDNERLNLNWRKARRSMNNGNCAEVATAAGMVAVWHLLQPDRTACAYFPADLDGHSIDDDAQATAEFLYDV